MSQMNEELRNAAYLAESARRDPHVQALTEPRDFIPAFKGAQFIGYVKGDAKWTKNGGIEITFVVDPTFVDDANPLIRAIGVPVSVDVQVWRPYSEAVNGT